MEVQDQLLLRVREDAKSLSNLALQGINAPLDQYLDTTSLNALCVSLSLDASQWELADLERILIIRDGLYDLRNKLRDEGDDAEHSVEQVLYGMDRLYADLERALRAIGKDELSKAQQHLARGREGPQLPTAQATNAVEVLKREANELLTQTYVSHRRIEVNFIKIESLNIELFKNAKLIIERLSASVFAIKLSLEQSVVLQGTFKLLTEGADRVLASLRGLVEQIGRAYGATKDFLADWSKLAEKGDRFTKMVGNFLKAIFGEEPQCERHIEMRLQTAQHGPALLCGYSASKGSVLLGGRDGLVALFDTATARVTDQRRVESETINTACAFGDMTAIGTDAGLEMIPTFGRQSVMLTAPFQERVMAVVAPGWGAEGSEGAIVTGSREGALRCWTTAGHFSEEAQIQTRRAISRILVVDGELIVASGTELLFINEDFEVRRRIRMEQPVNDMVSVDKATIALCGLGTIATVNLAKGVFTRLVISSSDEKYTSLMPLEDHCVCVGTETGKLIAVDLNSAAEIGELDLGFTVRGLVASGAHRLVAFGGSWSGRSKNLAVVNWRAKELQMIGQEGQRTNQSSADKKSDSGK